MPAPPSTDLPLDELLSGGHGYRSAANIGSEPAAWANDDIWLP